MSGRYSERRECGCRITLVEDFGELVDIELAYCPKHKAAPEMYEALKGMLDIYNVPVDSVEELKRHDVWLEFAQAALALADGSDA